MIDLYILLTVFYLLHAKGGISHLSVKDRSFIYVLNK